MRVLSSGDIYLTLQIHFAITSVNRVMFGGNLQSAPTELVGVVTPMGAGDSVGCAE
jgi:hypothetical protein